MPTVAEMRSTVEAYLALVADGTAAEIAALYSADATIEDPVGAEPLVGNDAVLAFYKVIEPIKRSVELHSLRVAGNTAVFAFTITTYFDGTTVTITPTDIMVFGEDGLVTSMRAVWAQDEMIFG